MGREQKRKELKKIKHKKINESTNKAITNPGTTIKIIICVLLILLALYYGIAIFVTKEINLSSSNNNDTNENTNEESTTNVSNKILAANAFKQLEETYYVYYYDFDDENEEISNSIGNLTDYTIYRVDTGNNLNKNYITEEDTGNKNATTLEELKVINPTLIQIENDHITAYYEGVDSITNFINNR